MYLSIDVMVCLFVCLSVSTFSYLSVCPLVFIQSLFSYFFCQSIGLFLVLFVSICLFHIARLCVLLFVSLSVSLHSFLSIFCLSLCPLVCQYVCIFVILFVSHSVYLTSYMSVSSSFFLLYCLSLPYQHVSLFISSSSCLSVC